MSKKFLSPIKLAQGSTNPSTGTSGELFFNTSDSTLYIHDGSVWNPAGSGTSVDSSTYLTSSSTIANTQISGLGTASTKDIPATGNASTSQVVYGTDTRLSDSRTPLSHVHAASDVTSGTLDIGRIPTGTTGTTVALGNHTHSDVYEPVITQLPISQGGTGATTASKALANLYGYTTTATASGTTVLTNTSTVYQLFTGTTTQTVTLPVTSTLQTGWQFHIVNNSTENITVNSSGGNAVIIVPPQTTSMVSCIGTTLTTAADWESGLTDFTGYTGTGNVVMATNPTITIGSTSGLMLKTTTSGQVTTLDAGSAGQFLQYDGTWATPTVSGYVSQTNGTVTTAAVGSSVVRNITVSTATPSGGNDGDVWFIYV